MAKLVKKFQRGGYNNIYRNGLHINTTQCAKYANDSILYQTDPDNGNPEYPYISGNAWTRLDRGDMVMNGYDGISYDRNKYDANLAKQYNNQASEYIYKNFDSKTLDPNEVYLVNMYYQGSPYQEQAWKEATNNTIGTHTGNLYQDPKTGQWMVTHNIHGTVHNEPFVKIQGPNRKYGITAISKLPKAGWAQDYYWKLRNKLK